MPLYDYKCIRCGKEFEKFASIADRKNVSSPCCHLVAEQIIKPPSVHIFPEGPWEHISRDPIYVNDKRHLKDLCKEHNVYAPGVLD